MCLNYFKDLSVNEGGREINGLIMGDMAMQIMQPTECISEFSSTDANIFSCIKF